MRIEKRALAEMNRCYAANSIVVDGQRRILLATEGEGPCLAWSGADFADCHTVWDGPGGTMSIVPIPGTNGEFLAVQKFFRMFDWEQAKVVHVRPDGAGGYIVRDLLQLPYIHRFDLLSVGQRLYFIGCTLATTKQSKDDWSDPGKIWVAEYSGGALRPTVLKDGLTKNHGYSRLMRGDAMHALVTCEEGVFEVAPPARPGADWSLTQLMDWPVSDISALDIDADGELEFATIEAFHGSYFRVHKQIGGRWQKIFEHPEVSEFYHVVLGTTLAGQPVFVGGCRRGKQQLFYVHAVAGSAALELQAEVIEEGVGPSNVYVLHEPGRDILVAANREKAEAALYFVSV
ncbi:MAG: hypothetical protein ACR2I0_14590 [Rhodoferax sp.]